MAFKKMDTDFAFAPVRSAGPTPVKWFPDCTGRAGQMCARRSKTGLNTSKSAFCGADLQPHHRPLVIF